MTDASTANDSTRPPLPKGLGILLSSAFLVTAGLFAQVTALGKLVFDITGRTLDLGLLGLAEFLPTALLAPLTGSIADRFDRRRIVSIAYLAEAVCSVGLAVYAGSDPTSIGPILAIAAVFGTVRAFAIPAQRALPADLAHGPSLARTIALNSSMWQLAFIVGPVVAGFLYTGSPSWPFVLAAATLVVGAGLILFVPLPPRTMVERVPGARATIHQALEGLRFIRRNPILFGAISLDLFAVLFGGAVALLPAIADVRLGVGAVGLGWLRASIGIGAATMTAVLAMRPVQRRVGRRLLFVVAVFGVGTIVLGLTRSYVVAFVVLAVISAADAVSVNIRGTLVPLVTPPEMRGRVLAVENVFIGASNELGAFESGVAGELFGLVGAVVAGGVGTLVVVAVWTKAFPALRDVDRFVDVIPPESLGEPMVAAPRLDPGEDIGRP